MVTASPSHQLASGNAEQISTLDNTQYAAIFVKNRNGNGHNMQIGGPQITATTGGQQLASGEGFWFGPAANIRYRLTEIYAAGTTNDWVDTICIPPMNAV